VTAWIRTHTPIRREKPFDAKPHLLDPLIARTERSKNGFLYLIALEELH
jgi:hypothetical protein